MLALWPKFNAAIFTCGLVYIFTFFLIEEILSWENYKSLVIYSLEYTCFRTAVPRQLCAYKRRLNSSFKTIAILWLTCLKLSQSVYILYLSQYDSIPFNPYKHILVHDR